MRQARTGFPSPAAAAAFCACLLCGAPQARAEQGLTLGAVLRAALEGNPELRLAQTAVDGASAAATQAQGIFDPVVSLVARRDEESRPLTAAERLASGASSFQGRAAGVGVGVSQRLQSGVVVSAAASADYAQDSLAEGFELPSQAVGNLALGATLPLARGRGEDAVAAGVRAAQRELDAAGELRRFSASAAARDAAVAYWNYLAGWQRLEIARAGQRRAEALVEELRKLVAADELPAAELDLAAANAAERDAERIAAEQSLLEARQLLGRVIGLSPEALARMPMPAGAFPEARAAEAARPESGMLRDLAERSRGDWAAQRLRIAAARERLAASRDLARPQIDLSVSVSTAGLREGASMIASPNLLAQTAAGPSVSAQLSIEYPPGNRAALGAIGQATAALADAEIRLDALHTEIAAAVESAAAGAARAALQLRASADTVGRYGRTVENERTKRRLGVATLIDVISVEERYQNALLTQVERRRNYAVSLARLSHELGALVRLAEGRFEIDERSLTELFPR